MENIVDNTELSCYTDNNSKMLAENSDMLITNAIVNDKSSKDILAMFNDNETKRGMLRVNKLSSLYDKITGQISNRIDKHPENFSNDDLIKYMKTVQDAIATNNKTINDVNHQGPAITVQNNTQINVVNGQEMSRESRQRIDDAVKAILAKLNVSDVGSNDNSVVDADFKLINEEEE